VGYLLRAPFCWGWSICSVQIQAKGKTTIHVLPLIACFTRKASLATLTVIHLILLDSNLHNRLSSELHGFGDSRDHGPVHAFG
jgi:hypothetical protein